MIREVGFELVDWQRAACDAWETGAGGNPHTGTLEIFTGGGKTLIAIAAMSRASRLESALNAAVVVPTEALAHQWVDNIIEHTSLSADEVGLLGAGGDGDFEKHRVLVAVINTAAKQLPSLVVDGQRMMLIVDECHRAGAATFSRVLDTHARFRLGLSATPDREEFDESGEPLEYDAQIVGRLLGEVVYRFTLRDARTVGWLPEYDIHHHGIALTVAERSDYEELSRRIDDLADRLRELGVETGRARGAANRTDDVGKAAKAYVAMTAKRKDLLYRASERGRIAGIIVRQEMAGNANARVLLFHERIDQADQLYSQLRETLPDVPIALEHSRLPKSSRASAIQQFRDGRVAVLVSVKSLVEGIDVPNADVGVSVAASSSVRQRVQSLGRVLRRQFDDAAAPKHAKMHLLYVTNSADEAVYGKENWADLTGKSSNYYWVWSLDAMDPESADAPPRTPKPTEEEEWQRLGATAPTSPQPWLGEIPAREFSVDTRGNVHTAAGNLIVNGQNAPEMVQAVRGRPGGRFYLTPAYRLVIVQGGTAEAGFFVAGAIPEPFTMRSSESSEEPLDIEALRPGDGYGGPDDKTNGTFKLSQKQGGVIERKMKGGNVEYATVSSPTECTKVANAEMVLSNWRALSLKGMTFHINRLWHAWYAEAGEIRFLGDTPEGFAWPSSETQGA